jgi:hypothetical protein
LEELPGDRTRLVDSTYWTLGPRWLQAASLPIQSIPYGRLHNNLLTRTQLLWNLPRTCVLVAHACFDRYGSPINRHRCTKAAPGSRLTQNDAEGASHNPGRAKRRRPLFSGFCTYTVAEPVFEI